MFIACCTVTEMGWVIMSEKPKTRKPRENKREAILVAAMEVFCHYGYDGATLDKVARAAGVSKALIIKYYGTLREIVTICLNRVIDGMLKSIQDNAELPGQTFRGHLDFLYALFQENRPQYRMLLTFFLTPAHEEITKSMLPSYLTLLEGLGRKFPETESLPSYKSLNYAMYSFLVAYLIGGNEENYQNARDETLALYLNTKA